MVEGLVGDLVIKAVNLNDTSRPLLILGANWRKLYLCEPEEDFVEVEVVIQVCVGIKSSSALVS